MSQNLLTIDMITPEALRVLENTSGFLPIINRQYDSSFAKTGAQIGTTLKIRLPQRYMVTYGAAFQPQALNNQYTTLTIEEQMNIGLAFTTAEQTMKIGDYSKLYIRPAVSQIASIVDYKIARNYRKVWNSVGTPGTTPSSSLVLLQANQKLNENATPPGMRHCVFNPAANTNLIEGMKGLFNPVSQIAGNFKKGILEGDQLGFDTMRMTQSIDSHTTGTRAATGLTVTTTIATQGTSTISISGGSASQTIKEGDVFTIAAVQSVNPQTRVANGSLQQFVVTADVTADGAGVWSSVSIQPPLYTAEQALATVNAFPIAVAAITFWGAANTTYPQNLAFHEDAFTLGTADLQELWGGIENSRQVYKGVSLRIAKGGNFLNDVNGTRLDLLMGTATLRPETAVRIWG